MCGPQNEVGLSPTPYSAVLSRPKCHFLQETHSPGSQNPSFSHLFVPASTPVYILMFGINFIYLRAPPHLFWDSITHSGLPCEAVLKGLVPERAFLRNDV